MWLSMYVKSAMFWQYFTILSYFSNFLSHFMKNRSKVSATDKFVTIAMYKTFTFFKIFFLKKVSQWGTLSEDSVERISTS